MKLTVVALLAASLVSAQNFDGVPQCAQDCLKESIPDAGCSLDDTACTCSESTQAKLRSLVTPCFLRECNAEELIQAQRAGAALCEAQSSATASDQGTDGTMSILPTDVLPPPVSSPSTPGAPSITTISSPATPPAGGNTTTSTRTTTSDDSSETGGSGGGDGDGSDGDGTTTSTDGAPMATAGLVAALLAAAIAI